MTQTYAAADIGSNTAHLLVAASDGQLVMRLDNVNEWIPLGEVVARTGRIPIEMIEQLVLAVREFRRVATAKRATQLYVFATEAMRVASNHLSVLKTIHEETGVIVDLIPPSREAALSVSGVLLDSGNLEVDMVFEVGGGSAQVGVIRNGKLETSESFPLGTGRVIAQSGLSNPCPPTALDAANRYIESTLASGGIQHASTVAVLSGGVGRGLWRALHPDGEKILHLEELEFLAWTAARLPLDRLIARFGVKQKRAGTLLPGALVYSSLMRRFGLTQITVSEFGVREGAVLDMANGGMGQPHMAPPATAPEGGSSCLV